MKLVNIPWYIPWLWPVLFHGPSSSSLRSSYSDPGELSRWSLLNGLTIISCRRWQLGSRSRQSGMSAFLFRWWYLEQDIVELLKTNKDVSNNYCTTKGSKYFTFQNPSQKSIKNNIPIQCKLKYMGSKTKDLTDTTPFQCAWLESSVLSQW